MSKFCKIVQDLLPNYIEKVTCDETNDFIEKHLKKCEACSKYLNNMKNDDKEILDNNEKIDYMEKINKKIRNLKIYKAILTVIIILFLIYAGITTYRYIILTDIYNKQLENQNINNIYYFEETTESYYEYFEKDGIIKRVLKSKNSKNDTFPIIWHNRNTEEDIMYYSTANFYVKIEPDYFGRNIPRTFIPINTVKERIVFAMNLAEKIELKEFENKNCYFIASKERAVEEFIEKDTGLIIYRVWKNLDNSEDKEQTEKYEYSLNTVTDKDVEKRTDLIEATKNN